MAEANAKTSERAVARSSHELDMLHGPILNKYIRFIIPLALGYILQLLFNAADIIVVGRFDGSGSLAAVGSTTALVNLYLQIYIGIAAGVNIIVAGAYATGNSEKVSKIVHTSVGMALLTGFVFLTAGLLTVRPMLEIMGSPDDIIDRSALYMYIYCLGMPASVLYNFGASILRSIGDTKRPMYYLVAAGIINCVLNIISVVIFHMGVAGVAIATTASNCISALLVVNALLHEESALKLEPRKIALDRRISRDILQYGVPIAIQNSFFSIPNVMIQSSVNSFGSLYVAGNAASQSIEGFQIAFLSANGIATATFISQHYGARKFGRADRVLRTIMIGSVLMSWVIGACFMLLRIPLLGLYNQDPEVIAIGVRRLRIMVCTDFLDVTMCNLSNAIRGYGHSFPPTLITLIFVCGFRMVWLLLIFPLIGQYEFIILAWPISWMLAIPVLTVYYFRLRRTLPKGDEA